MTPTSTPRDAIYEETGILDVEHTIKKNRINMFMRLEETKNDMINKILGITSDN